jgi:preprotein translocase subunit SecB
MGHFAVKAEELDGDAREVARQVDVIRRRTARHADVPVQFSLVAVGVFAWQGEERSREATRRAVGALAPAMLYDALREAVKYITHLGPYKPFLLPPLEFSLAPDDGDEKIIKIRKDDA